MIPVHLDGVAFAHPGRAPLYADVHLAFAPGWYGLVGANGAGKSTLLALLAGELAPTAGQVRRARGLRVATCPQPVHTPGAAVRTLAERVDADAFRIRGRLGLDPARLEDLVRGWTTLSGGERKRWQVGAALVEEPDVLLLDEPGNHLDIDARSRLVDALRRFRGVGVLVSHDRQLLDEVTTATVRIARARVALHPGGVTAAEAEWTREDAERLAGRAAAAEHAHQARGRAQAARTAQAATERGRSGRALARNKDDHDARTITRRNLADWADARAGRTAAVRRAEAERAAAAVPAWDEDLEVSDRLFVGWAPAARPVLARHDGPLRAGERLLLDHLDVAVGRADRHWLVGPNGAGKSTLLRSLARSSADALYLPQELGPEDVEEDLRALRALPAEARGRTLALVAALGVPPPRLLGEARPSPGEARKLRLALGLGRHVPLLLLDEPTNHLDLPAVARLGRALADFPGAMVLVEHDPWLAREARAEPWSVLGDRVSSRYGEGSETSAPVSRSGGM